MLSIKLFVRLNSFERASSFLFLSFSVSRVLSTASSAIPICNCSSSPCCVSCAIASRCKVSCWCISNSSAVILPLSSMRCLCSFHITWISFVEFSFFTLFTASLRSDSFISVSAACTCRFCVSKFRRASLCPNRMFSSVIFACSNSVCSAMSKFCSLLFRASASANSTSNRFKFSTEKTVCCVRRSFVSVWCFLFSAKRFFSFSFCFSPVTNSFSCFCDCNRFFSFSMLSVFSCWMPASFSTISVSSAIFFSSSCCCCCCTCSNALRIPSIVNTASSIASNLYSSFSLK